MNFGEVLSRAWRIIWKHKVLWIFGIFAGLASGSGGGGGGGGSRNGMQFNANGGDYNLPFGQNVPWSRISHWFATEWWIFIVIALIVLALIVVVIVLSTFGRIGLARGAWQADDGATRLTFGKLFGESAPYFWRVFGLNLLIFVLWVALIVLITVPTAGFAALTAGIGLICAGPFLILLCCLLVPLAWAVSLVVEQAIVAIVNEDLSLIDGLKRGWQVFRDNLGPMTIMFLILGVGSAIVRFIIALPAIVIAVPLIGAAIANTHSAWVAGGVASLVLLCLYIPVALVLNGVITAYISSAWAVTFRRLTGRNSADAEVIDAPAASEA